MATAAVSTTPTAIPPTNPRSGDAWTEKAAPIAASANCASESWPPSPVTTVTESATMATATTTVASSACEPVATNGTTIAATIPSSANTHGAARTSSGRWRAREARRGRLRVPQVSIGSRTPLRVVTRVITTATRMTTSINPLASGLVAITCSTIPSIVAANTAIPKLAKRAIAAPARPLIRSSGPSDSGVTTPFVGMMSVTANAATVPAIAQEMSDMVLVGTPAVSAASAFEAAARIARPVRERHRNTPRTTSTIGERIAWAA